MENTTLIVLIAKRILKALTAGFIGVQNPVRNQYSGKPIQDKPEKKEIDPRPELRAINDVLERISTEQKTANRSTSPYQKCSLWAAWAGVFVVFLYTCATFYQSRIMKEQLVGTQGAVVVMGDPQLNTNEGGVSVAFVNRGLVAGHFSAKISIIKRTSGGQEKSVGEYTIPSTPILKDIGFQKEYPIIGTSQGFSMDEVSSMTSGEQTPFQTLIVRGSYSTEDGFGDKRSGIPFCYSWFYHPSVIFSTGTLNSAGGGFYTCEMWDAGSKVYSEAKRYITPPR